MHSIWSINGCDKRGARREHDSVGRAWRNSRPWRDGRARFCTCRSWRGGRVFTACGQRGRPSRWAGGATGLCGGRPDCSAMGLQLAAVYAGASALPPRRSMPTPSKQSWASSLPARAHPCSVLSASDSSASARRPPCSARRQSTPLPPLTRAQGWP
jgi:hypothetical protein